MASQSTSTFAEAILQGELLLPRHLAELPALQASFPDPRALAKELLNRDWLTAFQANQIFQGRGAGLAIGPYVLLGRLGQGGGGQVFKARQRRSGRVVALKRLLIDNSAPPEMVRRFEREILVVTALEHPHLIRAFDAEVFDSYFYLVMEDVEGADLEKLVKEQGPLAPSTACLYVRHALLALQHAHEQGLVHRDIKPSNLLLSASDGLVKLLDLGLASFPRASEDGAGTPALTGQRRTKGTPDFMAPEQIEESREADIRADIYSLGCTYYYLLTGQGPFGGKSAQESQPKAIEEARPDIPSDQAAVLRRMMAKDPALRFQTPAEAIQALDNPVSALQLSAPVVEIVPERPAEIPALMLPVAAPMAETASEPELTDDATPMVPVAAPVVEPASEPELADGATPMLPMAAPMVEPALGTSVIECPPPAVPVAAPVAEIAPEPPVIDQSFAKTKPAIPDVGAPLPPPPRKRRKKLLVGIFGLALLGCVVLGWWMLPNPSSALPIPESTVERTPRSPLDDLDPSAIPMADRLPSQPPEVVAVLGSHGLKHRLGGVSTVALHPNDKLAASGGDDGFVRLWETATGRDCGQFDVKEKVQAVVFSPRGNPPLLVAAHRATATLLEATAEGLRSIGQLTGHQEPITSLAFAPDGAWLATVSPDQGALLWDMSVNPPKTEMTLKDFPGKAEAVAFGAKGDRLVVTSGKKSWTLYQRDGKEWRPIISLDSPGAPCGPTFSADGKLLYHGTEEGFLYIWDLAANPPRILHALQEDNFRVLPVLSPTRSLLAIGRPNGSIRLLDIRNPAAPALGPVLAGHSGPVLGLAFAADGRSLVSAGQDASVRFWQEVENKWHERWPPTGHTNAVLALAFAPDNSLASFGSDMALRLWSLPKPEKDGPRLLGTTANRGERASLAFMADGKTLALAPGTSRCTLWNPADARQKPVEISPEAAGALCLSRDGKVLAIACQDGSLALLDTLALAPPRPVVISAKEKPPRPITCLTVASDGRTLAGSQDNGELRLWRKNAVGWQPPEEFQGSRQYVTSLLFVGDGSTFLTAGVGRVLNLWDCNPPQPRQLSAVRDGPRGRVAGLAISPDERTLAAIDVEGRLMWWNVADWSRRGECEFPVKPVSLVFALDGRHLALGLQDGTIYVLRLPADLPSDAQLR